MTRASTFLVLALTCTLRALARRYDGYMIDSSNGLVDMAEAGALADLRPFINEDTNSRSGQEMPTCVTHTV